MVENPEEINR